MKHIGNTMKHCEIQREYNEMLLQYDATMEIHTMTYHGNTISSGNTMTYNGNTLNCGGIVWDTMDKL